MLNSQAISLGTSNPQLKPLTKLSEENQVCLERFLALEKIRLIPGVTSFEHQGIQARRHYILDTKGQWWVREAYIATSIN